MSVSSRNLFFVFHIACAISHSHVACTSSDVFSFSQAIFIFSLCCCLYVHLFVWATIHPTGFEVISHCRFYDFFVNGKQGTYHWDALTVPHYNFDLHYLINNDVDISLYICIFLRKSLYILNQFYFILFCCSYYSHCWCVCLETGSHNVTQAGLEFLSLLSQPPKTRDYRSAPSGPVCA